MKLVKISQWRVFCVVAMAAVVCATDVRAEGAGAKLCRGLAGIGLGFLELPGNMVEVGKDEGFLMGVSAGFLKGVMMTVTRYVVGLYETLTFPIPAPAEYRSPLTPDYPWGYFTGDQTKAPAPGEEKVEQPTIVPFSERPQPAKPAQPTKK